MRTLTAYGIGVVIVLAVLNRVVWLAARSRGVASGTNLRAGAGKLLFN
jgi:hypothetical protein